jgi:hypothetical protein
MKSVLVCFSKIKLYIIMHRLELFRSYMIFLCLFTSIRSCCLGCRLQLLDCDAHMHMATTTGRLAWIRAAPVLPAISLFIGAGFLSSLFLSQSPCEPVKLIFFCFTGSYRLCERKREEKSSSSE